MDFIITLTGFVINFLGFFKFRSGYNKTIFKNSKSYSILKNYLRYSRINEN